MDNGLRLELGRVFGIAHGLYRAEKLVPAAQVGPQLLDFFADRLKVVLRDRGVRHDLVDAVFALGGEDDLVRLLGRVQALQGFLGTDDGANLLTAYRRATNIVRIEEKKDGTAHGGAPEAGLLEQPEEKALFQALAEAERAAVPLLATEDFAGCMGALAALRAPVDAFFDKVTVNADQPPSGSKPSASPEPDSRDLESDRGFLQDRGLRRDGSHMIICKAMIRPTTRGIVLEHFAGVVVNHGQSSI